MRFLVVATLLTISFAAKAGYEPRDLLQKKASLQQVRQSLVPLAQWVKYPAYTDRAGWDALTGSLKKELITDGERYLKYEWKVITATDYLEYERSGSRLVMENPYGDNNRALSQLVFAELAEGKGRFIDQIINGVWQACEMSSWSLSAHLTAQKTKRNLPDYNEQIIDLVSGDLGSFLSWTWYFFHAELDKVNPIIASKLRKSITERILVPYMERSDYWWQAFNYKPGVLVNNWNPWCNANVLACFLLLEDDKDKLAAAVYRTMTSVDKFINYTNEDGACEEGPSYWGHAAGKLYDYLQLLSDASNGQLSIFNEPMIKNMGEYIVRSYVGNGWVVNFADASAKGGGEPGLIYRYGKATGSTDMQQFAAYLVSKQPSSNEIAASRDFFRSIENIKSYAALDKETPALSAVMYSWYPQTQFCYMKNKEGFFLAAKAGHNNESHNHNDVGTFSLYVDELPFFIDAGVGTYTRQTFSSERYSIWTMQSNYHNLPLINGQPQQYGAAYKARQVSFNPKRFVFSVDIAGAYAKEAAVNSWKRTYSLSGKSLTIEDDFQLAAATDANQVNFLIWARPDISRAGIVVLEKDGRRLQMKYDTKKFSAAVEVIPQTDSRLSKVWGNEIYRLQLNATQRETKGKYIFTITR